MRVAPTAMIGLLAGLLYAPVFIAMLLWSGVPYPQLQDTIDTVTRAVLVPESILAVILIALVSWLGWWRPILRDDRPVPGWIKVIPAVFALAIIGGIAENWTQLSAMDQSLLLITITATLLVGFNEELVYRGIAVVGLRGRLPEWQVWLFSSLMFAALHAWNYVAGQDLASTALQVVVTFGMGSMFYLCRRASGTIIVPMLLHGFYDFLGFRTVSGVMNLAVIVLLAVTALALWPTLRRQQQ